VILASEPVAIKYFGFESSGYLCIPRLRRRGIGGKSRSQFLCLASYLLFGPGLYTAPTLKYISSIRFGGEERYRAWEENSIAMMCEKDAFEACCILRCVLGQYCDSALVLEKYSCLKLAGFSFTYMTAQLHQFN